MNRDLAVLVLRRHRGKGKTPEQARRPGRGGARPPPCPIPASTQHVSDNLIQERARWAHRDDRPALPRNISATTPARRRGCPSSPRRSGSSSSSGAAGAASPRRRSRPRRTRCRRRGRADLRESASRRPPTPRRPRHAGSSSAPFPSPLTVRPSKRPTGRPPGMPGSPLSGDAPRPSSSSQTTWAATGERSSKSTSAATA